MTSEEIVKRLNTEYAGFHFKSEWEVLAEAATLIESQTTRIVIAETSNDELLKKVQSQAQTIAELQKDKERLDWLQAYRGTLRSWSIHQNAMNFNIQDEYANLVAEATGIRQAIDAATKGEKR